MRGRHVWFIVQEPAQYCNPGHWVFEDGYFTEERIRNMFVSKYTIHRGLILTIEGKQYPI